MIVVLREPPDRWTAARDAKPLGVLRALMRPDQRRFLYPGDLPSTLLGPLLDAALSDLDGQDVYLEIDESEGDAHQVLALRGFEINRWEHRYELPVDQLAAWDKPPDGLSIMSAVGVDVDRLRDLDDRLRHEVPGTRGWRNDPAEFAKQTFTDPEFDSSAYLIAVNHYDGGYVGLVRVWRRAAGPPRLGLIGVLPDFRRQGLATALLARAFEALRRRGEHTVCCEVDETNTASNALMARLGARRVGGALELVRR